MIYLARRNPATSHEEFLENWASHAQLSSHFPSLAGHFRRVIQCDALPGVDSAMRVSRTFDGVNLLTMRGVRGMAEVWEDPAIATHMEPDELRVFETYVRDFALQCVEEIVMDGPHTEHLALRFLSTAPGIDRKRFVARWARGADVLGKSPFVRRVVHDHPLFPAPTGYEFDGIEELWFSTVEDRAAFFADDVIDRELSAQREILDESRSHLVVADVAWAAPPPVR